MRIKGRHVIRNRLCMFVADAAENRRIKVHHVFRLVYALKTDVHQRAIVVGNDWQPGIQIVFFEVGSEVVGSAINHDIPG